MYSIKNKKEPVREVQRILLTLGYGESHLVPMDGIFGENTRLALMNFQQKNALEVTGVVNYETYLVLLEEYEKALEKDKGELFPLVRGTKNEFVRLLHAYLNLLFSSWGSETLTTDIFDEKTREYLAFFYARIGRREKNEISERDFLRLAREARLISENDPFM